MEEENEWKIQHYQQKFNWDCGVTCVLMVLDTVQKNEFLENFEMICSEEGFGTSTWTIDLCYLLRKFNQKFIYTTITLGVDPDYQQEAFYSKIIDFDSNRVKARFRDAKSNNIIVEKKTCTASEISHHLKFFGPIIALVDANRIHTEQWKCWLIKKSFLGHYILCVGVKSDNSILYFNPSVKSKEPGSIPLAKFEEARSSFGTDEDLIFIFHQ